MCSRERARLQGYILGTTTLSIAIESIAPSQGEQRVRRQLWTETQKNEHRNRAKIGLRVSRSRGSGQN